MPGPAAGGDDDSGHLLWVDGSGCRHIQLVDDQDHGPIRLWFVLGCAGERPQHRALHTPDVGGPFPLVRVGQLREPVGHRSQPALPRLNRGDAGGQVSRDGFGDLGIIEQRPLGGDDGRRVAASALLKVGQPGFDRRHRGLGAPDLLGHVARHVAGQVRRPADQSRTEGQVEAADGDWASRVAAG